MSRRFSWVLLASVLLAPMVLAAALPSPVAKSAFDKAEKAFGDGKFDDAVRFYKEAIAATPGYAEAHNGLGSALFKLNKREEALVEFKAAIDADPNLALAWSNMGYAARKMSDFKTAVGAYEKYTQLDANDPDGFYGLGESYKNAGDKEKAIAAYETYLQKETRPSEQKYKDKAKESIETLRKAQAATAQASPAPTATPSAEAVPAQASAPPLPGVAQKRIAEGNKLLQEKKFREASFAFQDAVNADPNNYEALFQLGVSYATLGYYSQAIERWQRVGQLTTASEDVKKKAQDNIARAQVKMAQAGGGSPQAQGKQPGSGPVADSTRQTARTHYEAAVKQIQSAEYSKALASLNECLKLEPALTIGYVARGSALIGLSRFSEAALDYQYALKLDSGMAAPLYGLGEAYLSMNRPADAKGYYQRYVASSAADVRTDLQSQARSRLEQLK